MVGSKSKISQDFQDALSDEMIQDKEILNTVEEELSKIDTSQYDPQRLALIKYSLETIKNNVEKVLRLMDEKYDVKSDDFITAGMVADASIESALDTQRSLELHDPEMINGQRVVEGVFDGNTMIGSDGKQYTVPANYASKSKLVEGDILKLTITNAGSFIFKQIAPIERRRLIGTIEYDEMKHQYYASLNGKKWRLLTASVTYFKGEAGDEVVFIIPKNTASRWAAVENIIKEHELSDSSDDAQTGRPVDSPNPFSNQEIDFLGTGEL